MDRFRYQVFKSANELERIVGFYPINFDTNGDEFVPTSRHVELVNAKVIDAYHVLELGLVVIVQEGPYAYQIVHDDVDCKVGDILTGSINYHNNYWYSF